MVKAQLMNKLQRSNFTSSSLEQFKSSVSRVKGNIKSTGENE